jgi:DNA-binding HxlR family transcriptional regulator
MTIVSPRYFAIIIIARRVRRILSWGGTMRCGTTKLTVFDLLGDPWILALLNALRLGETRFSDLQRGLGINPITLSSRLKTLEEHQLLVRLEGKVNKQAVSYRLTDLGCATFPVLDALNAFGTQLGPSPGTN